MRTSNRMAIVYARASRRMPEQRANDIFLLWWQHYDAVAAAWDFRPANATQSSASIHFAFISMNVGAARALWFCLPIFARALGLRARAHSIRNRFWMSDSNTQSQHALSTVSLSRAYVNISQIKLFASLCCCVWLWACHAWVLLSFVIPPSASRKVSLMFEPIIVYFPQLFGVFLFSRLVIALVELHNSNPCRSNLLYWSNFARNIAGFSACHAHEFYRFLGIDCRVEN